MNETFSKRESTQSPPQIPLSAQQRDHAVPPPVRGNGIVEVRRHVPVVVAGEAGHAAVDLGVVPAQGE